MVLGPSIVLGPEVRRPAWTRDRGPDGGRTGRTTTKSQAPRTLVNVIALGSNVGDRSATLQAATARLQSIVDSLRSSSFFDTPYVGDEVQPPVLNAAVTGVTALDACCSSNSSPSNRTSAARAPTGAPRTLDLDLILRTP